MADDEFLSDDDYVPVPLKEVARHELHPAGTEARIADLEASVLFWKKDAIAGTTRIRELEARERALTKFAEFCDYHHRSCDGLKGQHLDCDCGYTGARDELRAALASQFDALPEHK